MKFSASITPLTINFVIPAGASYSLSRNAHRLTGSSDDERFAIALQTIQTIDDMYRQWPPIDPTAIAPLVERLVALAGPTIDLNLPAEGRVAIVKGDVTFKGQPIFNSATADILWNLRLGIDVRSMMRFFDKLQDNPSYRAATHLYDFVTRHDIVIDRDGDLILYRKVMPDSNTYWRPVRYDIENARPGDRVKVNRNSVNEDMGKPCPNGLHCGGFAYLRSNVGGTPGRIVLYKVNPRDVVALPVNYSFPVVRVCEYLVCQEVAPDPLNEMRLIVAETVRDLDQFQPSAVEIEHISAEQIITAVTVIDDEIIVGDSVMYTGSNHSLSPVQIYVVKGIRTWASSKYLEIEKSNQVYPLEDFRKTGESQNPSA